MEVPYYNIRENLYTREICLFWDLPIKIWLLINGGGGANENDFLTLSNKIGMCLCIPLVCHRWMQDELYLFDFSFLTFFSLSVCLCVL